ncbi:Glutathione-regulated potassium-efflux system protein KefC [Halioglobus japonicus]|nr:Glutathione-regulated potassium-efflux system protein KefC [Halioglobus japonicus]
MPGFEQLMLLLLAAVILVPLSARLGLGAVLGYLMAGVIVGPWGLGVIGHVDEILHVAEFGVILLLFVIGLELRPTRLWALRRAIFGFGSAQMLLCAALLMGFALLTGESMSTAAVVGLVLALSSTAFALQLIAERGEMTTRWGRSAFGTLLFQDLAVVPLLALLPLLGTRTETGSISWLQILQSLAVLLVVVFAGRFLLRQVLRIAALSKVREILTATALLVAFGMAYLLEVAGLSMALGAFLAGVLLADSEYRHQLEADIEPFKGLLLGLFFIAVGMSLNVGLVTSDTLSVGVLIAGIIAIKLTVLFGLGCFNGLAPRESLKLGIALSQGGEFAFVLFGVAVAAGAMSSAQGELYSVAVSLSMVVTPLLFIGYDRWERRPQEIPAFDEIEEEETPVIIVGFGRFGQVVARILSAMKIPFTALDASPQQVDFVRLYGNEIYYGDGSRMDLLEAAGAHSAKILVLAIDDVEASMAAATVIRSHFPALKVFARARNRNHAYRLMDLGVKVIQRETFLSAVDMGRSVLEGLGVDAKAANDMTTRFAEHDARRLNEYHSVHDDEEKMRELAKEAARELEEMFARDASELARENV